MLTFNLKKEWFEKIKSGEKTHEYRECKPYWTQRLYYFENTYEELYKGALWRKCPQEYCCFQLGYPKYNETDKILYGQIKTIKIINGKNTDLKIDKDVYDIEFELIGE